ncbi:MAG: PD-(D/E)XK nuclease family transposase, partial [Phormidesmis sp.]
TFPIQEQAQKGPWDFQLSSVYTVGILDFVFDDHKDSDTILHTVELKNQRCEVFYDKLKFIYLELPKFKKTIEQLETHFDKWLFLLKHLPDLDEPPTALQEDTFMQLFEVAEIANFSYSELDAYGDSLKYYRDLNNVVDTSRQEGWEEGREDATTRLVIRLLEKRFGALPEITRNEITMLTIEALEELSEALLDFSRLDDLDTWLIDKTDSQEPSF